jgi:hypothetical protein
VICYRKNCNPHFLVAVRTLTSRISSEPERDRLAL